MRVNNLLVVVLFILCVNEIAFAQRCPASVRKVNVFVQNEHRAMEVHYEFIALKSLFAKKDFYSLEFLYKNFGVERSDSINLLHAGRSLAANTFYVEKFLLAYPGEKQTKTLQGNNLTGRVIRGELTIKASDMNNDLYLLKITSKNYAPSYILGQLLGGCYYRDVVLLENPK